MTSLLACSFQLVAALGSGDRPWQLSDPPCDRLFAPVGVKKAEKRVIDTLLPAPMKTRCRRSKSCSVQRSNSGVQTTQRTKPRILSRTMDTTRSLSDLLDVEPHKIDCEAFIVRTKSHPYEVKGFGSFLLTVIKRSPPLLEALVAAIRICPNSALTSEVGFNVNCRVLLVSPLGLACKCSAPLTASGCKRSKTLGNILETTGIHEPNFSLDLLELFLEELPCEFCVFLCCVSA